MRLHFDTTGYEPFFQGLWTRRLAELRMPDDVLLEPDPAPADFIVDLSLRHQFLHDRVFRVHPESPAARWPEKTFAWDTGDRPTGLLPGFFCSLPASLHDRSRHLTFPYLWRYNQEVRPRPLAEADHLFGFTGSISAPLRQRLFAALSPESARGRAILRRTESLWTRLHADGPDPEKIRYADELARCKFILCPKGNGISSIRLFETLQTGRVPVVLSDRYVFPEGVDWASCALHVPERELPRLPEILAAHESRWPAMAEAAGAVWKKHYADDALLRTLRDGLVLLRSRRRGLERRRRPLTAMRIFPEWSLVQAKRAHRMLLGLRRRAK